MKNLKIVFLPMIVSILIPVFLFAGEPVFKNETIRMCGGGHEWPPYYYFKRSGGKKTQELAGFDIDLFHKIFTEKGIGFTIKILPWKRCLSYVKTGDKYEMVFGGGLNDQRRKDYVTTEGYYYVTPTYFYSKEKFPNGMQVQNASDLKKNEASFISRFTLHAN